MSEEREFIREEEIITTDQIEIILGVDEHTAQKEFEYALKDLNTGSTEILLIDFCDLKGIDPEEAFYCLNPPKSILTLMIEDYATAEEKLIKEFEDGSITNNQ